MARDETRQIVGPRDTASGDSFVVKGGGPSGETARRDGRQEGPWIFGTEQSGDFSRAKGGASARQTRDGENELTAKYTPL